MTIDTMDKTQFHIRTYTHKELASLYCCSVSTLRKWLKDFEGEIGPRKGHMYNPRQVRVIVAKLGEP